MLPHYFPTTLVGGLWCPRGQILAGSVSYGKATPYLPVPRCASPKIRQLVRRSLWNVLLLVGEVLLGALAGVDGGDHDSITVRVTTCQSCAVAKSRRACST